MSTILITGGAGFIGRFLVERCVSRGWQVVVYDNLVTGKRENIENYPVIFYREDILNYQKLNEVIKIHQPQIIFHLAAHHYIPYCESHPFETIQVNVGGTASVMQAAIENGVKRVVFASTGGIYVSKEAPLTEESEIVITNFYTLSKAMAEQIIQFFYNQYSSTECVIARLFNVYGPYETNPHLIPEIIRSLKTNRDVVYLGNIHTKRDYIYVEDAGEALLALAEAPLIKKCDIFNVGSGYQFSAKEIVQIIEEFSGYPIRIIQEPARIRKIDKPYQLADIRKINLLTGWRPRHTFRDGLYKLLMHEGLLPIERRIS
ncbi:MAG: NAD(P)-dependent oxidoreductase [Candidatus Methanomethylicaceae archaeon]